MLRRKRAPARPEESVAVRLTVFSSIAVAVVGLGIFGGLGLLAFLCMIAAAAGHRWSWTHRHSARGIERALVGLGMGGATSFLLAELFLGVGADPFPQGTFLLLLIAITSFDVRSRTNCYSTAVFGLLGIYATASLAYDDTVIALVVIFAITLLAILALTCRADALGHAVNADIPAAPALPVPHSGLRLGALAGLGLVVALGAAVTYAATPPYEGALPIYPVSADLPASASFSGAVLNPLLPIISTRPPQEPRSGYYGFAPELTLGRYGPLDRTVLMRVRSTGWSYWRMQTYDTYTGRSWRTATDLLNQLDRDADGSSEPLVYPQDDGDYHPKEESGRGATQTTIRQTFTIVRDQPNLIAAAYRAVKLYFPSATIWQRINADDLIADQPLHAGTTYSVISQLPEMGAGALRAARGPDPWPAQADGLDLPPLAPSVIAAARQAGAGASTRYDRVVAMIGYLHGHARYDLTAPALPPGAEGVATLLATGRGYCEQFATALTVLARLNGIPARLVTGFAPGEYNPISHIYTVRASDAHAWTEVYFPGHGWLPFDATPSYVAQPQPYATGGWLLGSLLTGHGLPRPDWARLARGGGAVAGESGRLLRGAADLLQAAAATGGGLPAFLVLLLSVVIFRLRHAFQLPWPARRQAANSRQAVLHAYAAAERDLRRHGYPPRESASTLRRYAREVAGHANGQSDGALAALAELAMAAVYSARPMTPNDVAAARRLSRMIKAKGHRWHGAR